MPSLKQIRKRIASVRNTQKITKSMKMVSAAKLRRAQERLDRARPYAETVGRAVARMASLLGEEEHPLLARRPHRNVEVLVVTGDRGLCGSSNSSILRTMEHRRRSLPEGWETITLNIVGRKARDFFEKRGGRIVEKRIGLAATDLQGTVTQIAAGAMGRFLSGETDAVYVLYNHFRTAITQMVTWRCLLPIGVEEGAAQGGEGTAAEPGGGQEFLYEPSKAAVLDTLLRRHVEAQILRVLLESQTSEQAARMTAMDAATKNASEMIDHLTLQFNKARQAAITKELMEIVGGAEAIR